MPISPEMDGTFSSSTDFFISISSPEDVYGNIKQELVNLAMKKNERRGKERWGIAFFVLIEVRDEACKVLGEVSMDKIVQSVMGKMEE